MSSREISESRFIRSWPPKNYLEIERRGNNQILKKGVATLLRPIMHKYAGEKVSHWFDWEMIPVPEHFKGLTLPAGENAFHTHSVIDNIRMSLGGWQSGATVGPDYTQVNRHEIEDYGFLYAWLDPSHDFDNKKYTDARMGLSQIIARGEFRLLRGPEAVTIFGVSAIDVTHEVPLRVLELFDKRSQSKYQQYPLL